MSAQPRSSLAAQTESSLVYLEAIQDAASSYGYLPAEGRTAADDGRQPHHREDVWQGELYEQSDMQAEMALLVSIQNMSAAIEDAGRRPAAFLVLLRATLEAASSAHYLASPQIETISERARRGLNEMLAGSYQQWKALKEYELDDAADEKLQKMNDWLDRASSYVDLQPIVRAHERPRPSAPFAGSERPTISRRIDALFPSDGRRFGRWLYSALSAPSHSESHGYAIAAGQVLQDDGTQRLTPKAEMTENEVARFSITCLVAIFQAVRSVFARFGWPHTEIEAKCDAALAEWQKILT